MEINKEVAQQLEVEKTDIIAQAGAVKIKTEADCQRATAMLAVIKGMQKKVTATFKPMLDAAKATLNTIKSEHAKFADPLEEAEESLREKVGTFMVAETAKREAKQAKIDAKVEKAESEGKFVVPTIVAKVDAGNGISTAKRYYAEVTDIKALCAAVAAGEVPVEYVKADLVVLNKIAIAMKESFRVPGVVAKFEISTIVRGV